MNLMDNWDSGVEGLAYARTQYVDNVAASKSYHDRLNGNVRSPTEHVACNNRMVRSCQKRTMTRNGFEYTLKPACLDYVDSEDENRCTSATANVDVSENDRHDNDAARVIFCNHVGDEGNSSSENRCSCCLPRVGECENLSNRNADFETTEEDVCNQVAIGSKDADVYAKSHYGYDGDSEPIHMTLEEVKDSLKQLYKNGDEKTSSSVDKGLPKGSVRKGPFHIHLRHKKSRGGNEYEHEKRAQHRKSLPSSIRQTFCSLFGGKKNGSSSKRVCSRAHSKSHEELSCSDSVDSNLLNTPSRSIPSLSPFTNRALPPLPTTEDGQGDHLDNDADVDQANDDREPVDFATSIRQVKDYGWYWGPISGEMAERILVGEPDGSFIVRDSSDNHYIFSLTFKLNGLVRHVRIEHDQGNFSFGTFTNFKSQTIVEFIENAVKHSRSGRYLFFLHRRPMLGPMRVQLLHPVSRFKQVQSLQHRCRFVLLKVVRWDLIDQLPLPKKLKEYLKTPQYYTEEVDVETHDDENRGFLPATTPEQNIVLGDLPDTEPR